MHFTTLTAERFRGFSRMGVKQFGLVNCVLGENNAGKTSLLEALYLLSGVTNPHLLFKLIPVRKIADQSPAIIRTLFFQSPPTEKFLLTATTTGGIERSYSLRFAPAEETVVTTQTNTNNGARENDDFQSLVWTFSDGYSAMGESRMDYNPMESSWKIKNPTSTEQFVSLYYMSSRAVHDNVTPFLDNCVKNKNLHIIVNALHQIDSRIQNVVLGGGDNVYVDMGTVPLIPMELMGDGIRRITALLATMLNYPGGVVLVDEIENGLYYSTLPIAWESILEVAQTSNVQIVATTHSAECMKALATIDTSEKARFIRMERSNGGHRTIAMKSDAILTSEEIGLEVR